MKVKKLTFKHKGKLMEFAFVGDDEMMNTIAVEVYKNDYYKSLSDHIKDIKDPIVFDLGGHVGTTAIYFSLNHPNAKIYAFEPNPDFFSCFMHNTKNYHNIKCFNVAVGAGSVKRYLSTEREGYLADSFYYGQNIERNKVQVIALDFASIVKMTNVDHIDAMKIDIEGAEYEVFISSSFAKFAKNIDFIIGESHVLPSIPQVIDPILGKFGFKVEFLPFKNMHQVLQMKLIDKATGDEIKESVLTEEFDIPTMFKAWREK